MWLTGCCLSKASGDWYSTFRLHPIMTSKQFTEFFNLNSPLADEIWSLNEEPKLCQLFEWSWRISFKFERKSNSGSIVRIAKKRADPNLVVLKTHNICFSKPEITWEVTEWERERGRVREWEWLCLALAIRKQNICGADSQHQFVW